MRKIIWVLVLFFSVTSSFAKTKKSKHIAFVSGFYTYQERNKKSIGNIYEITIKIKKDNITIDSVWFDEKLVPCDVYETQKLQKVTKIEKNKTYLIKANKDLYKNFYPEIYKMEYADVAHDWQINILYLYKGKRYFLPLKNIVKKEVKPMRE
jgi:hypothetical protein